MLPRPRAARTSRHLRRGSWRGRARARLGVIASAVFVAALFFAQTAQLFHLLLVPHGTCEHGQLTHASHAPHASYASREPGATLPAEPQAPSDTPALTPGSRESGVAPSAPLDGEDHEHCDVNGVRHRLAEPTPRVAQATLIAILDVAALRASPERRPIAPLDLAPKSSPPSC